MSSNLVSRRNISVDPIAFAPFADIGSPNKEIIFIDAQVTDASSLLKGISSSIDVIWLDSTRDGLRQIAEALTGRSDVDAIHIVSHGSVGNLLLGSSTLSSENLADYAGELSCIGSALSDHGDLLLYGCDVAQGKVGQAFLQQLAAATGADVAASVDLTGNAALGGDWELEVVTGNIESSSYNLQSYQGVLRDYDLDYLLAEMSNLAYKDKATVSVSAPSGWSFDDSSINDTSGFAAFSFQKGNDIVIAYRGTNTDSVTELAKDALADAAIKGITNWNIQFTEALDFAWKIKQANPDAKIYVTGHSLGGALAQVVAQMFGFDGATFDPGGAANIAASTDFANWENATSASNEFIDLNANYLLKNQPELTLNSYAGVGANFLNYVVQDSLVSGSSGHHLGNQESLNLSVSVADNQLIIYANSLTASIDLRPYNLAYDWLASGVAAALQTWVLHDKEGILAFMSSLKDNQIALIQQNTTNSLQLAGTSGDISPPSSSSTQSQTEFHSSQYNPYVLANNSDNTIYGYEGSDIIYGFDGNDTAYAGDGDDTISTAQGNDVVDPGLGNDTVYAGSGDDTIVLGATSEWDYVDGGAGDDLLVVDFSAAKNYLYWYSPSYSANVGSSISTIQTMLANASDKSTLYLNANNTGGELHNIERYDITATDYDDLLNLSGWTALCGRGRHRHLLRRLVKRRQCHHLE